MPDVLALPLSEAVKMLQAAGWDYQVVRISSAYRHDNTDNCRMEEYVVRQQELADHRMLLSTIMKRRKEVLEHGLPVGAPKENGEGKYQITADECVECGACAANCPVGAISQE